MNTLNISDIERFFQFLDSNPSEIFTYAFFDENSKEVIKGHGVKFGILSEIVQECENFAGGGITFTLHANLNRTKLTGRKKKDIESVRVLCVDLDTLTTPEDIKRIIGEYHVQMVVESSPGKYHLYWKIDPGLPFITWSNFQLGLNHKLGGDLNLAIINHTIRVPGVKRLTKEGTEFMPRIVFMEACPPVLTQESVMTFWPWILDEAELARAQNKEERRIIGKATKELINGAAGVSVEKAALASNRNNTLFSLIYNCAARCNVSTSDVSEGITHAAALSIAEEFNTALAKHPKGQLSTEEIEKTVTSAYESGTAKREERRAKKEARIKELLGDTPMQTPDTHVNGELKEELPDETNNRTAGTFKYDYTAEDLALNRFSEMALAERVKQRFNHHIIKTGEIVYAFDRKRKVWRSQKRSSELLQLYCNECAKDTARDPELINQLCMNDNGEVSPHKFRSEQAKLLSFRMSAQAVNYVKNSHRWPLVSITEFDSDPYIFHVKNGVLNLLTGTIKEASAEDKLLRQSDVIYDTQAKCPYFENFLKEIFRDNIEPLEVIRFVQELFGYSLTGDIEEQSIYVHTGEGANGKSCLLRALCWLLGEYSARMQPGALTKSKHSMEKEVARMGAKIEGKRVVLIDDLDTKTKWEDALIKALTDETLIVRYLFEEEKDIPNRAKIHIGCNQTPVVERSGRAMDRRICILEYPREFTPNAGKLKEINSTIKSELSGILNWAIEGLKRVQSYPDKKILWPEEVKERVEDYQAANRGIEEEFPSLFEAPSEPSDKHPIEKILSHLKEYCSKKGMESPATRDSIGKLLKKLGYKKERGLTRSDRTMKYFVKLVGVENDEISML